LLCSSCSSCRLRLSSAEDSSRLAICSVREATLPTTQQSATLVSHWANYTTHAIGCQQYCLLAWPGHWLCQLCRRCTLQPILLQAATWSVISNAHLAALRLCFWLKPEAPPAVAACPLALPCASAGLLLKSAAQQPASPEMSTRLQVQNISMP
jgi:hypothetical protein